MGGAGKGAAIHHLGVQVSQLLLGPACMKVESQEWWSAQEVWECRVVCMICKVHDVQIQQLLLGSARSYQSQTLYSSGNNEARRRCGSAERCEQGHQLLLHWLLQRSFILSTETPSLAHAQNNKHGWEEMQLPDSADRSRWISSKECGCEVYCFLKPLRRREQSNFAAPVGHVFLKPLSDTQENRTVKFRSTSMPVAGDEARDTSAQSLLASRSNTLSSCLGLNSNTKGRAYAHAKCFIITVILYVANAHEECYYMIL